MFGLDFFLTGDEGHSLGAHLGHHTIVNLARQQAQRQADDAAGIFQHPLNGEMGFAGIGGAKYGKNAFGAFMDFKAAALGSMHIHGLYRLVNMRDRATARTGYTAGAVWPRLFT